MRGHSMSSTYKWLAQPWNEQSLRTIFKNSAQLFSQKADCVEKVIVGKSEFQKDVLRTAQFLSYQNLWAGFKDNFFEWPILVKGISLLAQREKKPWDLNLKQNYVLVITQDRNFQ